MSFILMSGSIEVVSFFKVYKLCKSAIPASIIASITSVPEYRLKLNISETIIKLFQKNAETGSPIAAMVNKKYETEAFGIKRKMPLMLVFERTLCSSM